MEATKPKSKDKKKRKQSSREKKEASEPLSEAGYSKNLNLVKEKDTVSTVIDDSSRFVLNKEDSRTINEKQAQYDDEDTVEAKDVESKDEYKEVEYIEPKEVEHVEHKTEEHVKPTAEEHVEPTAVEHVEPTAEEHVEPTTEEHVEPTAEEHVEPTTEEHVEPTAEEHVEPTAEEHVEPTAEEHVEPTAEEHVERTAEEHVERTAEEHVERTAEEHVERTAEEHVEHTAEEHVEHTSEEHVERTAEEHVEEKVEGAVASCPTEEQMPQSLITPVYNMKLQTEEKSNEMGTKQKLYPVAEQIKVIEQFDEIKPFSQDQILSMYRNAELERNSEFIEYFILYQKDPQNNEFYELLKCYLRARQNLAISKRRKIELDNDVSKHVEEIWQMVPQTVTNKGNCSDGVFLTATHEYFRAQLNDAALSLLSHSLQEAKDHIQTTHSLHVYSSEVVRLQIEYFIYRLLNSSTFKNIPFNAPVSALQEHEIRENEKDDLRVLRQCVSDLFNFQRKPVVDTQFTNDTRSWLNRLIAVLLRKATLSDHLFILNHILRCPAGISEWAIPFVQPPSPFSWSVNLRELPSFGSLLLDHVITTLATIMLPVKARENFMLSMKKCVQGSSVENDPSSNIWVVVFDSEGEEDEDPETSWLQWHENDIVALLNQIPIGEMYRHVLLISKIGESDDYNVAKSNEQTILKLISFSTHLLLLFNEGFKTFNSLRFKQLTKRVSRFIRHTVQYVSDHWECYKEYRSKYNLEPHENAMMLRLQVEYDQFFLRATNVIFSSQKLGSWQFMAVLPYKCVSTQMMWRILWVLHNTHQENQKEMAYVEYSWNKELQDVEIKKQFTNTLESLGESEAYYLLTTFSNMAIARDPNDRRDVDFVNAVSLEIFEIAFLCDKLRETLSREGRDLLASICTKHPHVISVLLRGCIETMHHIGMMALFLFRELPLHLWKLTNEDFDSISRSLLDNALNTPFNQLAKLILTGLNWGFEPDSGNLFLGSDFHRDVALLLVKACDRFAYDDGYLIYRSIQQVLFLAQSLRNNAVTAATPQGFAAWAWDILLSLRLHSLDSSHPPWVLILAGKVERYSCMSRDIVIPSLYQNESNQPLMKGLNEKKPIALFVALMTTDVGHNTDIIIEKGLPLWSELVAKGVYYASAHALYFLLPFFYSNPDKLIENEKFIQDLQIIILADLTYTSVAKSLVVQEFPGKTLKFLAGTMLSQIKSAKQYTVEVGGQASKLWCVLLLKVLESGQKGLLAKWKGADHVFYLLDVLMENAIIDGYLIDTLSTFLTGLVKNPPTPSSGVVASIFSAMTWSGSVPEWPSLIPSSTLPSFPWLFWFTLSAETAHKNMNSLWKNILNELAKDYKSTPDTALRKSASNLKLACPKLDSLPIYRWARNSIETATDHPSLPLLWQRFFALYLQRTENQGNTARGSVGFKFFDGDYNLGLLKKMQKRLIESADKFSDIAQNYISELNKIQTPGEDELDEVEKEAKVASLVEKINFNNKLTKIYRAFSLWIREPRLHDMNLNLSAFPPQYFPDRLIEIIQFDNKPWLDLIDLEALKQEICDIETFWHSRRRVIVVSLRYGNKEDTRPEKRILNRLQTYEESVPPPQLQTLQPVVLEASIEIVNNKTLFMESAQSGCRTICEQACAFSDRLSRHSALDIEYLGLLPLLYTNINAQKVKHIYCPKKSSDGCEGPAPIVLKFKEAHKSQSTESGLDVNRTNYNQLVNESTQPPPRNVCCAVVYVENCVTVLVKAYRQHGLEQAASKNRLREMGLALFHHMMSLVGEATNSWPPTRQFLSSSLEVLGQEFVYGQEDQCLPLIKAVLSRPWLAGLVAPLFSPSKVSTETYIQLYQYLVKELTTASGHTVFVLLSKFDLAGWLKLNSTNVFERGILMQSIEKALTILGRNPEDSLQMVFDVYKNHLKLLSEYKFPEMYGAHLKLVLKGTIEQWLNIEIWNDVFKCLGANTFPVSLHRHITIDWFRGMAHSNTSFNRELLDETMEILTIFFKQAKDKHKTRLFKNLEYYTEKIFLFMGLISHYFIFDALRMTDTDTKSLENCCDLIWERLTNLFSWWLEPKNSAKTQVLDCTTNNLVNQVFINCLDFVLSSTVHQVISHRLFSKILKHYDKVYGGQVSLKEDKDGYVIEALHNELESLNWEAFIPDLDDLKVMSDLSKKLNPIDAFLITIFPRIKWDVSIDTVLATENFEDVKRFSYHLAFIIVNLRREIDTAEMVTTKAMRPLVEMIETRLPWHILSPEELKTILDNARNVFALEAFVHQGNLDEMENFLAVFFRQICGLSPPPSYTQTPVTKEWKAPFIVQCGNISEKRNHYIGFHVSLLITSAAIRKGDFFTKNSDKFRLHLRFLLTNCESAIATEPRENQFNSAASLMTEFLAVLGTSSPAPFQEFALKELVSWWKTYSGSLLLLPCVFAACKVLPFIRHVVILAEAGLNAFCTSFADPSTPYGCWTHVIPILEIPMSRQEEFLSVCVDNSAHFCQIAYLMRILPLCQNLGEELSFLQKAFDWSCKIKPDEQSEPKILLIWDKILELSIRQLDFGGDAKATERVLSNFTATLLTFGEDKVSVGLLGAIGFGKKSPHSLRLRFMCRALATFIALQIPTNGEIRLRPNAPGHVRTLQEGRGRPSQLAQQAIGRLENVKSNKQYAFLHDAIEYVWNFIMDPKYSLRDGQSLVKELGKLFFPATTYLCILNLKQSP